MGYYGLRMLDNETKRKVTTRLRRVEGQVAGIGRMVDAEQYCVDILHQISAARAALAQIGAIVLARHVETCVAEALTSGTPRARRTKLAELRAIFARFGPGES